MYSCIWVNQRSKAFHFSYYLISLKSPYGVVLLSSMVERPPKSEKGCGFDPHSSNYDFRFDKG